MNVGTMEKFWIPFKYETLLIYCFGCERIGHGMKECEFVSKKVKNMSHDELPYSFALKVESNVKEKEMVKLNFFGAQR